MGNHQLGIDFQGLLVLSNGLIDPTTTGKGKTDVTAGSRRLRVDLQGLPKMFDGLVDPAALYFSLAEVGIPLGSG